MIKSDSIELILKKTHVHCVEPLGNNLTSLRRIVSRGKLEFTSPVGQEIHSGLRPRGVKNYNKKIAKFLLLLGKKDDEINLQVKEEFQKLIIPLYLCNLPQFEINEFDEELHSQMTKDRVSLYKKTYQGEELEKRDGVNKKLAIMMQSLREKNQVINLSVKREYSELVKEIEQLV